MRRRRSVGVLSGCGVLIVVVLLSLALGSRGLPLTDVIGVLLEEDGSEASEIVRNQRLPRTVIGLVAGAAIAVAGGVMQALTRNPLADPGLLGVNAGAGLGVAVGIAFFSMTGPVEHGVSAFVGALLATLIVLGIGRSARGGASPTRLVLAGVALAAVFAGISMALTMMFPEVFNGYRAWTVGTLTGRDPSASLPVIIAVGLALVLAVALGPALGALLLGEDHARALGTHVGRVRLLALVAVTLLAGGGTALMGPVVFLGLMVPHLVRRLTGPHQPSILLGCLVWGPAVLLAADTMGRLVAGRGEYPVSFMTAIIGAPALIILMTRRRVIQL